MKRQVSCLFNFSTLYSCVKSEMSDLVLHLPFINSIPGESLILYTYTPQKSEQTAKDISITYINNTTNIKKTPYATDFSVSCVHFPSCFVSL